MTIKRRYLPPMLLAVAAAASIAAAPTALADPPSCTYLSGSSTMCRTRAMCRSTTRHPRYSTPRSSRSRRQPDHPAPRRMSPPPGRTPLAQRAPGNGRAQSSTVRRLTASRPSPAVERRLTARMSRRVSKMAHPTVARYGSLSACGVATGKRTATAVGPPDGSSTQGAAGRFRPIDHALEAEPLAQSLRRRFRRRSRRGAPSRRRAPL